MAYGISTSRTVVFDGGRFALLTFRKQDGKYRYILYQEYGRKLKHGKRRKVVATVDVDQPIVGEWTGE